MVWAAIIRYPILILEKLVVLVTSARLAGLLSYLTPR